MLPFFGKSVIDHLASIDDVDIIILFTIKLMVAIKTCSSNTGLNLAKRDPSRIYKPTKTAQ